jgi:hypothetical protein
MTEEQRIGQDVQSEDLQLRDGEDEQVTGGRKAGENPLDWTPLPPLFPQPPPPPPTTK